MLYSLIVYIGRKICQNISVVVYDTDSGNLFNFIGAIAFTRYKY